MIQRIQTVYLFLAALCGVLSWIIPFGKATWINQPAMAYVANDSFFLTLLMILAILLAIIAIFLFKNRRLQLRLSLLGLVVSAAALVLEYRTIHGYQQQVTLVQRAYYWIGIALPVLMMLFFILAARGIRRDEKLVRSLDRLR
ncbi:MAG: DUF4293 family protein [Thermoflavifilum sp.]|nr:DUF4293 family protein [Thermoflavifilum sp.]